MKVSISKCLGENLCKAQFVSFRNCQTVLKNTYNCAFPPKMNLSSYCANSSPEFGIKTFLKIFMNLNKKIFEILIDALSYLIVIVFPIHS